MEDTTMNTYTKNTGYGDITLTHKTKEKQLTENTTATIHYLTKQLDTGTPGENPEKVLAHSTREEHVKDKYLGHKTQLENKTYTLEDIKQLQEELQ